MAAKKKILPYAKQGWTTGTGLYNEQLNNAMKTPYSGGQTYSGVTGYDDMANKMGYTGLAANSVIPAQTTIATPPVFDPYTAAANDGEALFKSMGNEILSGEAGGSFGTGVTVPGATDGLAGSLSGMWDSIGGTKGFADLAGGLGALGSLYTGWQQNNMAEQEHNARMGELARQRQRDADWQRDIKASGLGSYSAGMGGK